MVQVPVVRKVAAVPLTVQTFVVVEVNETGSPEEAVAASASGVPTTCAPGLANVIVCAVGLLGGGVEPPPPPPQATNGRRAVSNKMNVKLGRTFTAQLVMNESFDIET